MKPENELDKMTALLTEKEKPDVMTHKVSRGWSRFARIGPLGSSAVTTTNVTDCENDEQIPGLSVVGGIIFVSDPKKLSTVRSVEACVEEEPESSARLEMTEGAACTATAWCSEVETMRECAAACHALTGEWGGDLLAYLVMPQESLVSGRLA